MAPLEHFSAGPADLVRKLNALVNEVNRLSKIRGDGLIQTTHTAGGVGLSLSINRLIERIPKGNRQGVCKIVSNDAGGDYTITRMFWNGSAYVADTSGEFFQVAARDYLNRAFGRLGSTPIRFWTQETTTGLTEILIDSMPIPDIPNTANDYILVFDASAAAGSKIAWIQTTTSCP